MKAPFVGRKKKRPCNGLLMLPRLICFSRSRVARASFSSLTAQEFLLSSSSTDTYTYTNAAAAAAACCCRTPFLFSNQSKDYCKHAFLHKEKKKRKKKKRNPELQCLSPSQPPSVATGGSKEKVDERLVR